MFQGLLAAIKKTTHLQKGVVGGFLLVLFAPIARVYSSESEFSGSWSYQFIWESTDSLSLYFILLITWYVGTFSHSKWLKIIARIGFICLGGLILLGVSFLSIMPIQDFTFAFGIIFPPLLMVAILLEWFIRSINTTQKVNEHILDDPKDFE